MGKDQKEVWKTLADLAESILPDERVSKEVKAIEKWVIKAPMSDLDKAATYLYAVNHPGASILEAYYTMKA